MAVGAALEELLEKVIEGTLPNSRGVLLEQLASMGGTGADSCEQEDVYKRQVTHVLVNDTTRGYGIFAENMVQSADAAAQREAA